MNAPSLLGLTTLLLVTPWAMAHDPAGFPKNYCEGRYPDDFSTHDYAPVAIGIFNFLNTDGNLAEDCNGDTIPADYDGHSEWAQGGSILAVDSGDGVTGGTIACYGEPGHHPTFGPIHVFDVVLGPTVQFLVGSDTVNLVPPTDPAAPNCGDNVIDEVSFCVGSCSVTFPAGFDGAYFVNAGGYDVVNGDLPATLGHVVS